VETTFRRTNPDAPKGKPLVTLKDAAAYIMALPKKEAASPEFLAMETEERRPDETHP
jgi:hypothetical protein